MDKIDGEKKNILLAEDDRFLAKIYGTKLAKEGFLVATVGNGEEALQMAREQKPDLILLDLMMPLKDGFETLKELKADSELKNIPVVVLSNLSLDDEQKKVLASGAAEYAVKTEVFSKLVELVRRNLR
jgi:DNA-binding response OmpR family regulator